MVLWIIDHRNGDCAERSLENGPNISSISQKVLHGARPRLCGRPRYFKTRVKSPGASTNGSLVEGQDAFCLLMFASGMGGDSLF